MVTDLSGVDFQNIYYRARPSEKLDKSVGDVLDTVRETFLRSSESGTNKFLVEINVQRLVSGGLSRSFRKKERHSKQMDPITAIKEPPPSCYGKGSQREYPKQRECQNRKKILAKMVRLRLIYKTV
jgi:hypothetical protein